MTWLNARGTRIRAKRRRAFETFDRHRIEQIAVRRLVRTFPRAVRRDLSASSLYLLLLPSPSWVFVVRTHSRRVRHAKTMASRLLGSTLLLVTVVKGRAIVATPGKFTKTLVLRDTRLYIVINRLQRVRLCRFVSSREEKVCHLPISCWIFQLIFWIHKGVSDCFRLSVYVRGTGLNTIVTSSYPQYIQALHGMFTSFKREILETRMMF